MANAGKIHKKSGSGKTGMSRRQIHSREMTKTKPLKEQSLEDLAHGHNPVIRKKARAVLRREGGK